MEIRGFEMLGKAFHFILSNKNIFVFALKMRRPETPIKFIKALGEAIRCISSKVDGQKQSYFKQSNRDNRLTIKQHMTCEQQYLALQLQIPYILKYTQLNGQKVFRQHVYQNHISICKQVLIELMSYTCIMVSQIIDSYVCKCKVRVWANTVRLNDRLGNKNVCTSSIQYFIFQYLSSYIILQGHEQFAI